MFSKLRVGSHQFQWILELEIENRELGRKCLNFFRQNPQSFPTDSEYPAGTDCSSFM